MDALILAGGKVPEELAHLAGSAGRGLLPLGGRPMIAYVLQALQGCGDVDRIAVTCSPQDSTALKQLAPDAHILTPSGDMIENALAGIKALDTDMVMVTTADVPLVTSQTYDELFAEFGRTGYDTGYAVVSRERCEASFPGGRRTYARLADATVTAGNAVIVPTRVVERIATTLQSFYRARKNPFMMARLLGPAVLLKALTHRLKLREVEAELTRLAGSSAGAVVMQDAAIAFDVDKLDDYKIAESVLRQRATAGGETSV